MELKLYTIFKKFVYTTSGCVTKAGGECLREYGVRKCILNMPEKQTEGTKVAK